MNKVLPGQPFPQIDLPRVGGGRIGNADFAKADVTVLNVYRGLHCPRCRRQMGDFLENAKSFAAAGAQVISISTDNARDAAEAARDWELGEMIVGHDLSITQARAMGLFISETIREAEPAEFAEAAIFLISKDGTLWGSVINTFPFIRPTAEQILDAIRMKTERSYPPRGNLAA